MSGYGLSGYGGGYYGDVGHVSAKTANSSDVSGDIRITLNGSATANTTTDATGSLGRTTNISASITNTSDTTGNTDTSNVLRGTVEASAPTTARLSGIFNIDGNIDNTSNAAGTFSGTVRPRGSIEAEGNISGGFEKVETLTATASGSADMSSNLARIRGTRGQMHGSSRVGGILLSPGETSYHEWRYPVTDQIVYDLTFQPLITQIDRETLLRADELPVATAEDRWIIQKSDMTAHYDTGTTWETVTPPHDLPDDVGVRKNREEYIQTAWEFREILSADISGRAVNASQADEVEKTENTAELSGYSGSYYMDKEAARNISEEWEFKVAQVMSSMNITGGTLSFPIYG